MHPKCQSDPKELALNVLSIYKNAHFRQYVVLYVVDINAFEWYKLGYNNVLNIICLYVLWDSFPLVDGNFHGRLEY